jgi:hypothetical protein
MMVTDTERLHVPRSTEVTLEKVRESARRAAVIRALRRGAAAGDQSTRRPASTCIRGGTGILELAAVSLAMRAEPGDADRAVEPL